MGCKTCHTFHVTPVLSGCSGLHNQRVVCRVAHTVCMVSHSHLLCVVPVTAAASCSPRGIWSLPAPSYTSSVVDPTQPTATTALAAATAPAAYTPLSTIRVLAPDLVPASPATPHGKRPVECAGGDSFRITDSVDDCLKAAANKKPPGASKRTFQGLQQQLDHVISTPAGMMGGATAAEQASDAAGDDGSMVRPHRRSKSNLHRSHLIFSPGGMVSQVRAMPRLQGFVVKAVPAVSKCVHCRCTVQMQHTPMWYKSCCLLCPET